MITPRHLTALGALCVTLPLTGCSNDGPAHVAPQPGSTASASEKETKDPVSVLDYVEGPTNQTSTPDPVVIPPDLDLMSEMTCDPLPQQFLETNGTEFGIPLQSAHINVGQGLTSSEDWWVVVYDSPADSGNGTPREVRRYLTTAPSNPQYTGQWIELGKKDPWRSVHWPDSKLVVAQSALEKATQCLEG